MKKEICFTCLLGIYVGLLSYNTSFASPFEEDVDVVFDKKVSVSDETLLGKKSNQKKATNKTDSISNRKEDKKVENVKNSTKKETQSSNSLKPLIKEKVEVNKVITSKIGSTWDSKNVNYTNVQGFCTDGEYWYVALMSSSKDKYYTDQQTKLLKIDIKTKKVVAAKAVGKIGHSNSLTYNPKTKKILTATCSEKMCYICEFNASDLSGKNLIYPKDKKGKTYKDKCFASFSYDPKNDQYIVKMNNKSLGYFDSNFKLKKTVEVQHLKINDDMTGQAITCDGENIFSVCNNLKFPAINYILVYDMEGKYLFKHTFNSQFGILWNNAEMEQIACWNGKYWSLCNNGKNKFRIHELKLREN